MSFQGTQGKQIIYPQTQKNIAYFDAKNDSVIFSDFENSVWLYKKGQLNYIGELPFKPRFFSLTTNNILITHDQEFIYSY